MTDVPQELPDPDGDELKALVTNKVSRRIYKELVSEPQGLDINQLKQAIPEYADQMHFDRRLRDLDKAFHLERDRAGGRLTYRLGGRREEIRQEGRINKTTRAEVLYRDGSRCQMCGRNPQRDPDVILHIDHKVPLHWGGSNTEENLWVLCEPCNTGKKAYFSSVDEHSDKIKEAILHPEVHRRIGDLLRAFGDQEVPSYLLSMVASAQQFQEDWHRRLRELRELDWDYSVRKTKEGDRIVSYYRLTKDGGWPDDGTIRDELNRRRR